jgi:hypothetical protein
MVNPISDNAYDCPFGISNQKEIEKSNDRNSIMIENLGKSIKQLGETMNEKFDELNSRISSIDEKIDAQNDMLEGKIARLDSTLESTIEKVVENKFKVSIYGLLKWGISAAALAVIARVAVNLIFSV